MQPITDKWAVGNKSEDVEDIWPQEQEEKRWCFDLNISEGWNNLHSVLGSYLVSFSLVFVLSYMEAVGVEHMRENSVRWVVIPEEMYKLNFSEPHCDCLKCIPCVANPELTPL